MINVTENFYIGNRINDKYLGILQPFKVYYIIMPSSYIHLDIEHQQILWSGEFLEAQWLGLCIFTAEGTGSIPGQGTKSPQAPVQPKEKKKKNLMVWTCTRHQK